MNIFIEGFLSMLMLTQMVEGQLDMSVYPRFIIYELGETNKTWQQKLAANSMILDSVRGFALHFSNLSNISAEIMGKFPKVEILSLSDNKIENLAPDTFRNNKYLRRISLESNRVKNLSSFFKAIESSPLADTLEFLDLGYNGIDVLQAFPEIRRLAELRLNGNKILSLDGHVFRNLKSLQQLFLDKNNISHIEPDSFYFFNNPDRKLTLSLYLNRLADFQAIMNGLRNAYIDVLDLSENKIKSLVPLEYEFKVSRLKINNNMIESLGTVPLFSGNNALRELELISNQISSIEPAVFSSLAFSLRVVLHYNNLDAAGIAGLAGTSIGQLDLTGNRFSKLQPFPQMKLLKSLVLSYNEIETLGLGLFDELPSLKEIILDRNLILRIEPGVFTIKNNPNKLRVNLGENLLANFSQVMTSLATEPIEKLDLYLNRFEELDFFPVMAHLKSLNLLNNCLVNLENDFLKNIPNLEKLSIEMCESNKPSSEFLDSIKNVRYFRLNAGLFRKVPNLKYFNSSALKVIDLSRMPKSFFEVDDYAFERVPGSYLMSISPLQVNMFNNYEVKFSPKAFCSNYSDRILISKLQIEMYSFKQMNKCHLRQLRGSGNFSVELDVKEAFNQPALNVTEYCGCGQTRLLAMKYNIKITGFCLFYPYVECLYDTKLVKDDCDQNIQFTCPLEQALTASTKSSTLDSTTKEASNTVVDSSPATISTSKTLTSTNMTSTSVINTKTQRKTIIIRTSTQRSAKKSSSISIASSAVLVFVSLFLTGMGFQVIEVPAF